MDTSNPIFTFILNAIGIIICGVALAKSTDRIAELTGLGRALIGGILLAGATSLPELTVDIHAIKIGKPDLAVGDLLGSSLFNLLILAVVDAVMRPKPRIFSKELSHHAQTNTLSIVLTSLVGIGLMIQSKITVFGLGTFPLAIGLIYVAVQMANFQKSSNSAKKGKLDRNALFQSCSLFILAAAGILWLSPGLVTSADQIATKTGLGHSFIGTTLIALSTSLPELVSTIAAFRLGSPDLALGNIFGSNTFNMLMFIPLDAIQAGSLFNQVSANHSLTAFIVIFISGMAILGQTLKQGLLNRSSRFMSETMVILILVFLYLLYSQN